MTDMTWNGFSDSFIIVCDSFGHISVIDKKSIQCKSKKQATFQRSKLHKSGCNAVDVIKNVVFTAGDDGCCIAFEKNHFHLKRKKDTKMMKVLVKVVKNEEGIYEIIEDCELDGNTEGYELNDDNMRIVDVKTNVEKKIVAVAIRKGTIVLKRFYD